MGFIIIIRDTVIGVGLDIHIVTVVRACLYPRSKSKREPEGGMILGSGNFDVLVNYVVHYSIVGL
jgi:hypothetical protein